MGVLVHWLDANTPAVMFGIVAVFYLWLVVYLAWKLG